MLTRLLALALSLLLGGPARAQLTLRLPAAPAGTPAGAILFVAGSFNDWNPASPAYALARAADGSYTITLPAALAGSLIEFKLTRGGWASVESTASGADVPNRSYTFGAGPTTLTLAVAGWKDLAGGARAVAPAAHTATANVRVISEAFGMPQLGGRTHRVWLYLPTGYAAAAPRCYPVLYLQDGQNVFDAATSFAGEWGVDETLSQLQAGGLAAAQCIVVAVDNGGGARLDEYSPWRNEQHRAGGEGDEYVDFLVQTLKPYLDAHYRTQPGRASTGIGGSSLGALVATYAALKYPAVFGRVAAFSPAYWFAEKPLFDYLRQHPADPATRFYFVSGTTESTTMVPLMRALRDALQAGGVPAANLSLSVRADGKHAEWFWQREFAPGFRWLYAAAGSTGGRTGGRTGGAGRRGKPQPGRPGPTQRVRRPAAATGAR